MIPPRCSAFPCLFRHDCSRAFVARDGRAGGTMSVVTGDARRARGRDRRHPAGLMAAEGLAGATAWMCMMPSVGRKFLMAGRGGLNLTHSEPAGPFWPATAIAPRRSRHGWHGWMPPPCATGRMAWACAPSSARRAACSRGNEGRAAAARLAGAPARGRPAFTCGTAGSLARGCGAAPADLRFDTPEGERRASADAVVLALGGGSWAPSVRMAPGRRACARALPWRRCGQLRVRRGLVGNISASATRASRSSRCPCAAA